MHRLLHHLWGRPAPQQRQHQVGTHVSRRVTLLSLALALATLPSSAPAEQHPPHSACALHGVDLPSRTHHYGPTHAHAGVVPAGNATSPPGAGSPPPAPGTSPSPPAPPSPGQSPGSPPTSRSPPSPGASPSPSPPPQSPLAQSPPPAGANGTVPGASPGTPGGPGGPPAILGVTPGTAVTRVLGIGRLVRELCCTCTWQDLQGVNISHAYHQQLPG